MSQRPKYVLIESVIGNSIRIVQLPKFVFYINIYFRAVFRLMFFRILFWQSVQSNRT
jgi:hypothetical protein